MYSVIIQNARTQEVFQQYQSLFTRAIEDNRIGICKWNESGTTIETALPELSAMTEDKEEWRAVIVRYIDDSHMAACECSKQNPYDFAVNQNGADVIQESEVPLIRLTHMLGGVPVPEVKFEARIIKEDHKAARTIYVPVEDKEQEEAYRKLDEKYRFDGKIPSSIIIVSVRERTDRLEERIDNVWLNRREVKSSEFWKRNRYPSICRFLVYDYVHEGAVKKAEDDFNFWFSVMLLAVNDADSSLMQAYRLYTVKTVMDREKMAAVFQDVSDRLRDAKYVIEKDIRKEAEQPLCEKNLPGYRMDIPVVLKVPFHDADAVDRRSFLTFSKGINSDLVEWHRQSSESEEALRGLIKGAERTLDQTAVKVRGNCRIEEDMAEPLNRYQEEDMRNEINEDFRTFIRLQELLSEGNFIKEEKLQLLKEKVEERISIKVARAAIFLTYGTVAMLLFLFFIPIIIEVFKGELETVPIDTLAFLLGITALVAIVVPIAYKLKLNGRINSYNTFMKDSFRRLSESSEDYSEYLSVIVSHSRGASYLEISSGKTEVTGEEEYSKYRHIKAINSLLARIKGWSRAHHLEVDFMSPRTEAYQKVDTSIRPGDSRLYAIESADDYEIDVNNSGMKFLAPYPFAEKIEIVREELYDDECR